VSESIDARTDPYVLEGRVVTMGPQGVLPAGAIYIRGGVIEAVQPVGEPPPAGFAAAPRIRTGDSLYPGLIELHNHLSYNAMPLWDVPRRYSNNGQWKNHEDYPRLITKPSQVLGRTAGVVEALIRFVECRCLLGGTTTSQGITLSSSPGIQRFYAGIVRNVEASGDPDLPNAGTSIANPAVGGAASYLAKLERQTCYLQHLSEGKDDIARGWFHRLRVDDGQWAVTRALCGIHSSALEEEDFHVLAEHGASMVWSPLSNYLLYGDTIDLAAAKASDILMGIGCDWAPSGSKNLLGEMKVAWLASQEAGGVFTPQEIVAMATCNAARILQWEHALGTIEAGKRADLIAVDGQQGDDFLRLIGARETTLTLVAIGGIPRAGQAGLMRRFAGAMETVRVGRSTRLLNLDDETSHPLVQGLSLTEATSRLQEAMANLPALAQLLDQEPDSGLFAGSTDSSGTTWRIVFEFEQEAEEAMLARAAEPLSFYVQPMALDPIAVVDDRAFLRNLVAARNLPTFVKKGLPALYGETIPLPEGAGFLRTAPELLPPQVAATTQELKTFLRTWGELTLAQLRAIVEQGLLLLEQNYVHLPLKRAMHAVDPVQRLRLLLRRLEEADPGALPPEIEFHNELAGIFSSVRDLHTTYRLPAPFSTVTAWLPFLIEEYWEHGHAKYMVSKVVAGAGLPDFTEGVEVLYWNGVPIQRAIARNAAQQMGSNAAAAHARGLNALTIRPLARGLPPDEEWVTLRYRTGAGEEKEWTQPWLVFEPGRGTRSLTPASLEAAATALGLDGDTDDIQEARKVLFAGTLVMAEEWALAAAAARGDEEIARPIRNTADGPATTLPTIFRAQPVTTAHGVFGYIRIFSFNINDADVFVDEFVRLVRQLPQDGLIIDVRGNGGGLIHAAERLLQVLTPAEIEPQRAQFINSTLNLQICRHHAPSTRFEGFTLAPWVKSIRQALGTGATYSLGFPITERAACNDIGQRYFGPAVLITDALCYSATDIFAAGFQDHAIGPVLGIHPNTGAGGANVWSHAMLRLLAGESGPYRPLAGGADFRVAVRRTVRVGPNAGDIVEDLGIVPDEVHQMTRDDLIHGNRDLIARAAALLAERQVYGLEAILDGDPPALRAICRNLTRLDLFLDGRPIQSLDVAGDEALFETAGLTPGRRLELRGYDGDRLAATLRQTLT
jgi:cytosine/adenosine deaminase-related metal-dependent hydrolase